MEYKFNLSENQRKKIASAWKKKANVTIQLKNDQLYNGNYNLSLTERQKNQIEKAKKNTTGLRLEFSYDHLKSNHEGGFLPLLFAGLGALGALASGGSSIVNAYNNQKAKNKELEELKRHNAVIEGKGLKKQKSQKKVIIKSKKN